MIAVHPRTKEAYQLFHAGSIAFSRAELAGIRIDTQYCIKQKEKLSAKISELEIKISNSKLGRHWKHVFGMKTNLNSNQQLAHLLYKVRKIQPINFTESEEYGTTNNESLKQLGIPELLLLLEMRKLRKIRDTYLDAFLREQVNGWIHPFFNLHFVRTFRSSSDSPNFQNIPKRDEQAKKICRGALFPRHGHRFLSMDFSGIEVRMACCYTRDEKLTYDTIHGDMHKDMAIELYVLDSLNKRDAGESNFRQGAKNGFVFPQFYGDYYGNCAINLLKWAEIAQKSDGTPGLVHLHKVGLVDLNADGSIKNLDGFVKHVKHVEKVFWEDRYRVYAEWKEKTWQDYQQTGYVDLHTGFRCSGPMSKKDVCNYPFQGSAFHCLLWTFIEVDQYCQENGLDSRLVSQVHDELTADCADDEMLPLAVETRNIACNRLRQHWNWITCELDIEAEACVVDQPWSEKIFFELPKYT